MMPEFIKNITDTAKFFIMLLIYTGYMTWWASGISHDLETVTRHVEMHISQANHPYSQTQAIQNVTEVQKKILTVMEQNIIAHAKCTVIMDNIVSRMERLEVQEAKEHSWEKK